MKKRLLLFLANVLLVTISACNNVSDIFPDDSLSNEEVISGLKEALKVGTDTSVTTLNKTDGYFQDQAIKIFMPAEATIITDNLSLVPGGQTLIDEVVKKINRAAEDAAVEAKPIFVDAITGMTITDGFNILNGADNAATTYLNDKTYTSLQGVFQPKVAASLGKNIIGGISAESAYADLINTYNNAVDVANLIPGSNYSKVTTNSLSEHTTKKALDGLFVKVADEELAIRKDPIARVTDILKRVFGKVAQ